MTYQNFLIAAALVECRRADDERVRRARFRYRLQAEEYFKRERKIPRVALLLPSDAPFQQLYMCGSDPSLITLTGLDHAAFSYVLQRFSVLYTKYSPYSVDGKIRKLALTQRGRPRSMSSDQCLGLCLAWTRTRGSMAILSLLFGVTGSVVSLFLRFGRRILLRVLVKDPKASVTLPTDEELIAFRHDFQARHSLLGDVWAVADGLKLPLQQSGDEVLQNMYYNGWTHGHYVTNVLVFSPDGIVRACALNAPGALHDSTVSEYGGVYEKLEQVYERCGGKVLVDSAFSRGNYEFLIKSSQTHLVDADTAEGVTLGKQATSARQAAEWGMRALQGSFPRLKDIFKWETNGERKLMLRTCILLFNLRTRLVGLNQILTVYRPHLHPVANNFAYQ